MFGISGIELFIILAVAFLIFGPEEMPRIGRIIGQGLRMFNDARQEVEDVIKTEMLRPEDAVMLSDPLGLKGMQKELESTVKQISDPNYKPASKGAGMRVSTDDQFQKTMQEQAAVEAEEVSVDDTTSVEVVTLSDTLETIDPNDAASIWGVEATDAR